MSLLTFPDDTYSHREYVPDHIQQTIEDYLINGFNPCGFVTAMFAGDMFAAASKADHANGPAMQGIANWIQHNAPPGSWGSYERIKCWINDTGKMRTIYTTKVEKAFVIKVLKA